ncbi:MAG: hypothetical protein ABI658_31375 [Acidimicrobiales bacterium]
MTSPEDVVSIDWIDDAHWLIASAGPHDVSARLFELPAERERDRVVLGAPREIVLVGDTCPQPSSMYWARMVSVDTFMTTRDCNGSRSELLFVGLRTGRVDRAVAVNGLWVSLSSAEPSGYVGLVGECRRIEQLTPQGSKRINAEVSVGKLRWNLDDHSCSDSVGLVEYPSVLPSGGVVFRAGARYSPLTEDQPPQTLFFWDGASPRAVAWREGITTVGTTVVAHRSDTVALTIERGGKNHTELIGSANKHNTIYTGPRTAESWAPDDAMLIVHDKTGADVLVRK